MRKRYKDILFYLTTKLAWLFILFFGKTGFIKVKNAYFWTGLKNSQKGFLLVVWHGKMLLPIYLHRNLGITAMVSEHRDGEMITQTIHRLGYKTVRGSSTRGGVKAFRHMFTSLKDGNICTVLPDGPRGPRHEFKMGAILLAQRAGIPLLPMSFAARKPIYLKSWDRFTLWWPFTKVCFIYGEPVSIPRNIGIEKLEEYRQMIQNKLIQLEKNAQRYV